MTRIVSVWKSVLLASIDRPDALAMFHMQEIYSALDIREVSN